MTTVSEVFKDVAVTDVCTVAEFLDRYYKPDRYTGRGEEYAAAVLESHVHGFEIYGVDWISRHDSMTGQVVSFYGGAVKDVV